MTQGLPDIVQEFPAHLARIERLRVVDPYFARLVDYYDQTTRQLRRLEARTAPASAGAERAMQSLTLRLKGQIAAILSEKRGVIAEFPGHRAAVLHCCTLGDRVPAEINGQPQQPATQPRARQRRRGAGMRHLL
jgi:uncharacterized protein YdcH (DUF465 family)